MITALMLEAVVSVMMRDMLSTEASHLKKRSSPEILYISQRPRPVQGITLRMKARYEERTLFEEDIAEPRFIVKALE
jgi:hypothetical protein